MPQKRVSTPSSPKFLWLFRLRELLVSVGITGPLYTLEMVDQV